MQPTLLPYEQYRTFLFQVRPSSRRLSVKLKPPRSANNVLYQLFLLSVIFPSVLSARYSAPSDCEWVKIGPGTVEMSLRCKSTASSRDAGGMNFSHIESMYTEKLRIFCEDVYYEARLTDGSFVQLPHLRSLKVENCKVSSLSKGALRGLPELRNVTLRTYNVQWGTLSLDIEADCFRDTPLLEYLDLSMNNLMELPENTFFYLPNLKILNLSRNKLTSISHLGFERNLGYPGLKNLLDLDLSYNRIRYLPDRIFSSLQNVQAINIRDNKLAQIGRSSFHELPKVQILNLANNHLSLLPPHFLKDSNELRELYLQNNSITNLHSGTFDGLQQLLVLNLSKNHISSLGPTGEVLQDLVRLIVLDLSYNNLQSINSSNFQSQQSLQILYLDHNQIETISDTAFESLHNLYSLVMNNNRIRILDIFTLNGLYVLSTLDLNYNHIHSIHNEAFENCTNIQDLQLEGNLLTAIPGAINPLHLLKTLNVAHNRVRDVTNATFQGTKQLLYLNLEYNEIGNLTGKIFREVANLKSLELSHNKIEALEHGIFDDAVGLQVLVLNDNLLSDINGLFMNLHALELLNVSRNHITWFDYALLPPYIKEFDIHDNNVESLGNYFKLENVIQLLYIDASYNQIKEVSIASFPNKIEIINLRNNSLKKIEPLAFADKENLTKVDLSHNHLQTLDINALHVKIPHNSKSVPEFLIDHNPFYCDCTMEWLQRVNLDETGQYPKINLSNITCQLPFPRHNTDLPLKDLTSSDFLCKYRAHCFALCHCCDFDACDCEMVCPENCTCFSDQTWNTNIVECGFRSFANIPQRIPMDATELYLDGNNMINLSSHRFIGRKNLKALYLNGSHISNIPNRTFIGLQNLQILHLESNKLHTLHGYEFENLTKLKELYLSNNQLHYINNATFSTLNSLQVLHLQYNFLIDYNVWELGLIKSLNVVMLSHNQWSCNCKYLEEFHEWLIVLGTYVADAKDIRCYYNSTPGPYLLHYNSSSCSNFTMVTYFQAVFTEDFMPLMIILPIMLFLLILFAVVLCIYRQEVKMWLYSKYGVRIFHRTRYAPESEKLFDAFVSYCKKDEAFVSQILAPELECASPSYRLCLCYRDLPSSSYMSEGITEAVDCSHRTVAVISEQFLKNDWCRFELKTALREAQCNKKHRIILILLDKISPKDLDPDARMCLRSSVVIHWGDRKFWQKLRYAMPEVRVHKGHITTSDPHLPPLKMMGDSNNIKFV